MLSFKQEIRNDLAGPGVPKHEREPHFSLDHHVEPGRVADASEAADIRHEREEVDDRESRDVFAIPLGLLGYVASLGLVVLAVEMML